MQKFVGSSNLDDTAHRQYKNLQLRRSQLIQKSSRPQENRDLHEKIHRLKIQQNQRVVGLDLCSSSESEDEESIILGLAEKPATQLNHVTSLKSSTTPSTVPTASSITTSPTKKTSRRAPRSASEVVRKTQIVPLDDNDRPILPITLGIVTIHALGKIVYDRGTYHNKRYMYPVGFHSSRSYMSTVNPSGTTVYHSRILDGGESPLFEVTAEDRPEFAFQATSTTGAWASVMKAANMLRHKEYASNSASGPDYFGLSNATVAMMIEGLENTDRCSGYEWKRFDVGGALSAPTLTKPQSSGKRKRSMTKEYEGETDDVEEVEGIEGNEAYFEATPSNRKKRRDAFAESTFIKPSNVPLDAATMTSLLQFLASANAVPASSEEELEEDPTTS